MGRLPSTGEFPERLRQATRDEVYLMKCFREARSSVGGIKARMDSEAQRVVVTE